MRSNDRWLKPHPKVTSRSLKHVRGLAAYGRRFITVLKDVRTGPPDAMKAFFADPVAAFAHIRTALKPGGWLASSCWCAMKENDWVSLPFKAARDLVPPQAP